MNTEELRRDDLQLVVRRLPKDVRELVMASKGFVAIAGGFIRATIANEEPSDIDILSSAGVDADGLATTLNDKRTLPSGQITRAPIGRTKNAITLYSPGRLPVQFITRWRYAAATHLLDSFDFTVCQAAVFIETQQWRGICSPDFYPDLAAKRLRYTSPSRDEEAGGSLLRAIKFIRRGYRIPTDSLAAVIERLHAGVREGTYSSEQLTEVYRGLLREVDPLSRVDGLDVVDDSEPVDGEPD